MTLKINKEMWEIDKKYLNSLTVKQLSELEQKIYDVRYKIQFFVWEKKEEHYKYLAYSDQCLKDLWTVRGEKYRAN